MPLYCSSEGQDLYCPVQGKLNCSQNLHMPNLSVTFYVLSCWKYKLFFLLIFLYRRWILLLRRYRKLLKNVWKRYPANIPGCVKCYPLIFECVFVSFFADLYFYQFKHQCVSESVSQSVSESVSQSVCQSVSPSAYMSVHQSVSPSVCQSRGGSVCLQVCLSVFYSVSQLVSCLFYQQPNWLVNHTRAHTQLTNQPTGQLF